MSTKLKPTMKLRHVRLMFNGRTPMLGVEQWWEEEANLTDEWHDVATSESKGEWRLLDVSDASVVVKGTPC
jgi:hypothetical protein